MANAYTKTPSIDKLEVVIPNEHYPNPTSSKWKNNERALNDPTLSKTSECQHYSFTKATQKSSLVLIDTPGLGDTSGHLKDNKNVNMIFETIKSLPQISAIILVINGAMPRITSTVRNVLTRFQQFFPDSIYTNMIVVLTNCQKYSVSFDKDSLKLPQTCQFFHMQNSIYCQPSDIMKTHHETFKQEFEESMKTMNTIIQKILSLKPQTTKHFADLNDERYRLGEFLHESYLTIQKMEQIENELESLKTMEDLGQKNIEKLLRTSKDFVTRMISQRYNNTICLQCNKVCHKQCQLDEISSESDNPVSTCSKMKDGRCIQCRCPIERHTFSSKDLVKVDTSIVESIARARQRLRQEREDHASAVDKYSAVQICKTELHKVLDRQCDGIRQTCVKLKTSCENINIVLELTNFIQILNQNRRQLQSSSVIDRLERLIKELEQIIFDCEQMSTKNGASEMNHEITNQDSAAASSPSTSRHLSTGHRKSTSPCHNQSSSKSEVNATPNTGKFPF